MKLFLFSFPFFSFLFLFFFVFVFVLFCFVLFCFYFVFIFFSIIKNTKLYNKLSENILVKMCIQGLNNEYFTVQHELLHPV